MASELDRKVFDLCKAIWPDGDWRIREEWEGVIDEQSEVIFTMYGQTPSGPPRIDVEWDGDNSGSADGTNKAAVQASLDDLGKKLRRASDAVDALLATARVRRPALP